MSGGHFDYVQYRILQAAEELESYIQKCKDAIPDEYGYKPEYSEETLKRFRETLVSLKVAGTMLQRVDWLICSDDSEETFHKRLENDLRKLNDI